MTKTVYQNILDREFRCFYHHASLVLYTMFRNDTTYCLLHKSSKRVHWHITGDLSSRKTEISKFRYGERNPERGKLLDIRFKAIFYYFIEN